MGNCKGNNREYNRIDSYRRVLQVLQENGIDISTQGKKANYFSVSQPLVSSWESGKKPLPLETLIKVAHDFGVSLDWLVFGASDKEAPTETKKEPAEPIQKKNGYNLMDVCRALVGLSEIDFIHMKIDEKGGGVNASCGYTMPSFTVHIAIDDVITTEYLHCYSIHRKPEKAFTDNGKYFKFCAKCLLADFLHHFRPIVNGEKLYKLELLENIRHITDLYTYNQIMQKLGNQISSISRTVSDFPPLTAEN